MSDSTRALFEKTLNTHGYGFQAAVAKELRKKSAAQVRGHYIVGLDIPIRVRETESAIDIVTARSDGCLFAAIECKRVDPALGAWCFIRSKEHGQDTHDAGVRCEAVCRAASGVHASMTVMGHLPHFAHIGVEVSRQQKGDGTGVRQKDLNDAVSQALLGAQGWATWLGGNADALKQDVPVVIVPVVVTTAQLWLSQADLGASALETGHIDLSSAAFESCDWLCLQARTSHSRRHALGLKVDHNRLDRQIEAQAYRSVLVVNPVGLGALMTWLANAYAA